MLGYYSNSNAKLKGSNLNEKIQTLISLNFHRLSNIDTNKHTNKRKHTHTKKHTFTHIHTY